jgi:hypothetical protein
MKRTIEKLAEHLIDLATEAGDRAVVRLLERAALEGSA